MRLSGCGAPIRQNYRRDAGSTGDPYWKAPEGAFGDMNGQITQIFADVVWNRF